MDRVVVKMEKFDDYWRPGKPYLDKVEFIVVKEPATCSAMMQAGQADMWTIATHQEAADLRDMGYTVLTGPNVINNIYGDSKNADSPFANKKVREAVEYAIDRKPMSDALGFGFQEPINQLAPPGTQGYNPDYKGRPYDSAKAKQLLAEAGYSDGFKTTMTLLPTALDMGTIIQNYLAEIGIEVELDVADPGRYWGKVFVEGWQGLLLGVSALNPEYCVVFLHHFGPEPLVAFASLAKSPEFLEACNKVIQAPDVPTMRALTREMVTQASEDCMAIPLTNSVMTTIKQENVHTCFMTAIDWTGWYIWDDWLEKK